MSESIEDQLIHYFYEEVDFELSTENQYTNWILQIANSHDSTINAINYIFCSDEYLLKINQEYLNHDEYTDIISFPYAEYPEALEGDIFISIDMVRHNALKNKVAFEQELLRVMAHGILHFLGFKDKSEKDITEMRKEEDEMMLLFNA